MALREEFQDFFEFIAEEAVAKALDGEVPLVGLGLQVAAAAAGGLDVFSDLRDKIDAALASAPTGAQAIADALNGAAIPGLSASVDAGKVVLVLAAQDVLDVDLADGEIDLGSAAIGLTADAEFDATITSALNLSLSFDPGTGQLTLIDSGTEELTLGVDVSADVDATATLGFLGVKVTDTSTAPEIALDFALDIDGFDAASVTVSASGAIALGLELETTVPDDALPTFYADLSLGWDFSDLGAGTPTIRFDDLGVDLGSLVDRIAKTLSPITDIFSGFPIGDIIETLTAPLPIIDGALGTLGLRGPLDIIPAPGGDGSINLLDLAGIYFQKQGNTDAVAKLSDFAVGLSVIKQLTDLGSQAGHAGRLSLGAFDLVGGAPVFDYDGLTVEAFADKIKGIADDLLGENNVFSGVVGAVAGVIGEIQDSVLKTGGLGGAQGLSIPILDDPTSIARIFLPGIFGDEPVRLIEYDIPDLSLDFGVEFFFPILGPIGLALEGEFEAGIDFIIGYDTKGLVTGGAEDGLYVRTRTIDDDPATPEVEPTIEIPHFNQSRLAADGTLLENLPIGYLYGAIRAGAGVDLFVASAKVLGGILGTVHAFLPNGELRVDNFEDGCFFDPIQGRIAADVTVKLKAGIGFFSITKTFVIAEVTLADFSYGCHGGDTDPGFALARPTPDPTAGPALLLSAGLYAGNRSINGTVGVDNRDPAAFTDESFRVRNAVGEDDDGNPVLIPGALGVSAFGIEQVFGSAAAPMQTISALLGAGDDALFLDAAVTQAAIAFGGTGDDFLSGALGNDVFGGDDGDDVLKGYAGNDTLRGGAGADLLEGGAGADELDGGSGIDQVTYENSAVGVVFNDVVPLGDGRSGFRGQGGEAEGDVLVSVEYITGSQFNDVLRGSRFAFDLSIPGFVAGNTLEGLGGDDALFGGLGRDFLVGGAGADYLNGYELDDATSYTTSAGAVRIDLAAGTAAGGDAKGDLLVSIEGVQGSGYDDVLRGSAGANLIDGWYGDDSLDGRGGADIVTGGDGDDTVRGGNDGDTLDGGGGTDLLTYAHLSGPVFVNLRAGNDSFLTVDSLGIVRDDGVFVRKIEYSTFENVDGSQAGDFITGDLNGNVIRGLAGNDVIDGEGGNDTLVGGTGADNLTGGAGLDLADYRDGFGVTVNLALGTGIGSVAQGDTLAGIENLRGSSGDDSLTGDGGANEIDPGLSTGPGVDTVAGGAGIDTLVLDYSVGDYGRGLVGGFDLNSTTAGAFRRLDAAGLTVRDGVDFTEMEALRVTGTYRADTIYGGRYDDLIATGGGNDLVVAGVGNDRVYAGDGDDEVRAGTGSGRELLAPYALYGSLGVFDLDGGRGTDRLSISFGSSLSTDAVVLTGGTPGTEFQGVNLRLANGAAASNFELLGDVRTSWGNDALTQAGDVDNAFSTDFGQDTIAPGLGDDTVDGGYDFTPGIEGDVGVKGTLFTVPIANRDAFARNGGDLLILDYSNEDGPDGVVGEVGRVQSTISLFLAGVKGGSVEVPIYTNEGTYALGPAGEPDSDLVTFTEIERLRVRGSNQDDVLDGTTDGFEALNNNFFGYLPTARGDDLLEGLGGDDLLTGDTGDDVLRGGAGDDTLVGSVARTADPGNVNAFVPPRVRDVDVLTGGEGADLFVLGTEDGAFYGRNGPNDTLSISSRAILTDFDATEGDRLQLYGRAPNYLVVEQGGDTLIYLDGDSMSGDRLVAQIEGVTGFDLDGDDVSYVRPGLVNFAAVAGDLAVGRLAAASLPEAPDEAPALAPAAAELDAAAAQVSALAAAWVTQNNDPDALLGELFGPGGGSGIDTASATISLSGDAAAFGTFAGDPFGLGSGIVLSTGQVEDLAGPNTIDGGFFGGLSTSLSFEKVGRVGSTDIFRAELTGFSTSINSITIRDSNSRQGGAGGNASGFDLDGVVLSHTFLANGSLDGKTLAELNGTLLPRLDVFDFTAAGLTYDPGDQRSPTAAAYPNTPDLVGAVNGLVDNGAATLGNFDANGNFFTAGALVLGDGGSLGLNLTQAVSTAEPLYLYIGEAGGSGETLDGAITASNSRVDAPTDLSTDLGLPGTAGDTTSLTYTFTTLPGADVDTAFFEFALFSEELVEFAGSSFNDTFKITLNGVNLAQLSDGAAATVNSLRASPFGPGSPDLILNGVSDGPARTETRADAYTKVLTFAGALNVGGENTLVIEVADVRDGLLDSGILVKGGTFRAGLSLDGTLSVGGGGAAPTVIEGGPAVVVPVTLDPGGGGTPTAPITITFTPGENVDLGNGPGAPLVVTVQPGGPLTFDLPVTAPNDDVVQGGQIGVIGVEVASADPAFDGLAVAPVVVEIVAAPTITSDGGGSAASVFVAENTLAVTVVTAAVPDAGTVPAFAIVGGADAALFAIDAATGALSFRAAPDYDVPANTGGDNLYEVVVSASGGPATDTQALTITVTDVNDPTPFPDALFGTAGADLIDALAGNDLVGTGPGNDTVYGSGGNDTVYGDAGDDVIDLGAGAGFAQDLLGDNLVFGGDGGDVVVTGDGADTLVGAAGDDTIYAGAGDDVAYGDAGNDFIDLGAGDDFAQDVTGDNFIVGGDGDDTIVTGDGADTLVGAAGNDALYAGAGNDAAYGDAGDDFIDLGAGDDFAQDLAGDNSLVGGEGRDTIVSGDGADTLDGGAGDDTIYGNGGDDVAYGSAGNDFIDLGAGDDFIHGGLGDDILVGGAGRDTLVGGGGNDLFAFGADAITFAGDDVITDFAAGDLVQLTAASQGRTSVTTDGTTTYLGVETAPGQAYVIAFQGVTDTALVQGSVFYA